MSIEGARHKRLEMFCAPLLLEVGNAGTHLVRAQRQAGCWEGPLKNYLMSKYLEYFRFATNMDFLSRNYESHLDTKSQMCPLLNRR